MGCSFPCTDWCALKSVHIINACVTQGIRRALTFDCYKEGHKKLSSYFIQDMKIQLYSYFIQVPGTNRRGPKGKAAPKRTVRPFLQREGSVLMTESSFLQSQKECGLWAHNRKCLVSMKGSNCVGQRGWCTTDISKGEYILITASGLRKRN